MKKLVSAAIFLVGFVCAENFEVMLNIENKTDFPVIFQSNKQTTQVINDKSTQSLLVRAPEVCKINHHDGRLDITLAAVSKKMIRIERTHTFFNGRTKISDKKKTDFVTVKPGEPLVIKITLSQEEGAPVSYRMDMETVEIKKA